MSKKITFLILGVLVAGCASQEKNSTYMDPRKAAQFDSPALHKQALALAPKATVYTGENAPVIRHMLKGSAAGRAHLLLGDEVLKINNVAVLTATEFENKVKFAPKKTYLQIRRAGKIQNILVMLDEHKPRLGAGFEPEGTPLVHRNAPFVAFMHQKDLTAFTETSINEGQTDLHLNVILQGQTDSAFTNLKYAMYEKGQKSPFATGNERVDALSVSPKVLSKAFHKSAGYKGPIVVSLELDKKRFLFEFQ